MDLGRYLIECLRVKQDLILLIYLALLGEEEVVGITMLIVVVGRRISLQSGSLVSHCGVIHDHRARVLH